MTAYSTIQVNLAVIEEQPKVALGGTVTFTVVASGRGLSYQWFGPDGEQLSDKPGEIEGSSIATLQIFKYSTE